ncbi:MAG TPA: hypothetical protein VK210_16010 [Terriglobia bacterium]|nr:hypothetical protein [Terriglobia bacterium]
MPRTTQTIWLKTMDPVVPVKSSTTLTASMKSFLSAVQAALSRGVEGVPDAKRNGFYEIQIEDCWCYIHIPVRAACVYLIASFRTPLMATPVYMATARH